MRCHIPAALLLLQPLKNKVRPGGEIGRHVRLRGVCRKVCWFESSPGHIAEVVKLVDTHVSGACAARYAGSSPAFGTDD